MTGDFRAFFEAVRRAAREHGVTMHVVCGVTRDGSGGQVRVASHGTTLFEEKDAQFMERCVDTMTESLETTLTRLAAKYEGDAPQYLN